MGKGGGTGGCPSPIYLGTCHAQGQGVPQNYTQAAYWWGKAAAQGYADAIKALESLKALGHE
ncbi:MAG: SEL1-like repeat protein [Treponema sp.]|nr:SEL1-like repeat protein [Treponema sp.]